MKNKTHEDIRKLSVIAGTTYYVTLPQGMIKQLKCPRPTDLQ